LSAETVQDAIIKQLRNDDEIFSLYGSQITGSLTFTNGSKTVLATGSSFTVELRSHNALGDLLVKGGAIRAQGSASWYKIESVDTDTQLTLSENFAEATIETLGEHVYIRKGSPRNYNFVEDGMGILLYLTKENLTSETLPHKKQMAVYPFMLTACFYDDDDESAETRKTQYTQAIRRAIERNLELSASLPAGETITDLIIYDPRYYMHPNVEGGYYFQIPLAVRKREPVGDN